MRHASVILALIFCACTVAQDVGINGTWQLQTAQSWQQLVLNTDGTYQRHIMTASSRRTEAGRWHNDVSLLILEPDHVITAQGARVPLPPNEKHIDIAGVDATTLTLYYGGDTMEIWQRQAAVDSSPQTVAAAVAPLLPLTLSDVNLSAIDAPIPSAPDFLDLSYSHPPARLTTLFTPPLWVGIEPPSAPGLSVADDAVVAEAVVAAGKTTAMPKVPVARSVRESAPADMYAESKVVELITQIACEELRYPQRDLGKSEQRYRELAQSLGFELRDPAKLQRTLRYYQSNAEFLRLHQQAISDNSMRCVTAADQVSARQ